MKGFRQILAILMLFSFSLCAKDKYKYEIAVCAIFKNEAPWLKEWIEFHRLVGVEKFYLYNNLSSDHYKGVLKPYIKSGIVTLIDWNYNTNPDGGNWPTIQHTAYNHALKNCKNKVKWLAILDIDEFLFPVQVNTLTEFLKDYQDAPAVCANWQLYGTSNVSKIGKGQLMIEQLILKAPTEYGENNLVKSIVRPEFVEQNADPHCNVFLPGYFQVNANHEPFAGATSAVAIDKIRVNHYWTRDEDYFLTRKIQRRESWKDGASYERAHQINVVEDKAIFKYIPKLRKVMQ